MAQQTAMQEAIEYLKSFNLEASAIILEDKFLEKEKEQIINFGNDLLSQNDRSYIGFPDLAEQYYNETYNK
jgi:hypothetical protein